MSLNDLITSTNIQEDYLDGALQKDYTKHYSHSLYNEQIGLYWQNKYVGYSVEHNLKIRPSYTGGLIDSEYARMRTFCHYLLNLLPDEGLEEITESIQDAIEFYLTKSRNEFAQLSSPSFEISFGEAYERPIFQIAED